jgi:hypothetical protein
MINKIKEMVETDQKRYFTTLAELNDKQRQICDKLEQEVKYHDIDCKVNKVGDAYEIVLLYDNQDLSNDRAIIRINNQVPEFEFMRHEVTFLPFMRNRKDSHWKQPKSTADLFKMIEEDLYNYYIQHTL